MDAVVVNISEPFVDTSSTENRVIMSTGPGLGGEEVVLGGAEGGPPGPLAQEAWQGHQLEDQEVGGDI